MKKVSILLVLSLVGCTSTRTQPGRHPGSNSYDPTETLTFQQAIANMSILIGYNFGVGCNRNVHNLTELGYYFAPYGIAGTAIINGEWERYQPFNTSNFVFNDQSLELVARIPPNGGLYAGGITSGQVWTKQTYVPNRTGYQAYAFEINMKIPAGVGFWPASWFYTQSALAGQNDGSEIDNPEFFNAKWQNEFDWTGFQHGPGANGEIYSIKTNQWVWHPGLNFSGGYHNYQTLWTPDAVYKYVDGTLIYASYFKWTAKGNAQWGANLAVGSPVIEGMLPVSTSQFPANLSVEHMQIWGGK